MHPAISELLRYFEVGHLPEGILQDISSLFRNLAYELVNDFNLDGPELTVALRKLLEAKDAAVRSALK